MKTLAIFQNVWVREPARIQAMIERNDWTPGSVGRARLLARLLWPSKTGSAVMRAFGEEETGDWIVDESTPEIGNYSASSFEPSPLHVIETIEAHKPGVIVAFGVIAAQVVRDVWSGPAVFCPHPCARLAKIGETLQACARQLEGIKRQVDAMKPRG